MKLVNLENKVFGKLRVIRRAGVSRQGSVTWECQCECGNYKVFSSDHLTRKTGAVKSCGCSMYRLGPRNPLWKGAGEISGNWWYTHVARERKQTNRPKIPVDITVDYAWDLFLEQNRKCALSGIELFIENSGKYNTASIDRIDNSKGYVEGNVQWVHKHVNFMKRDLSQEYFIQMCKRISDNCEIVKL